MVNSFLECLNSVIVCLPLYICWNQCVMFVKDIHIYTHSHNGQRLALSLFIAVLQEKLTSLRTTVNKNSPSLTGNQNLIYCLSLSACLNTLYEDTLHICLVKCVGTSNTYSVWEYTFIYEFALCSLLT